MAEVLGQYSLIDLMDMFQPLSEADEDDSYLLKAERLQDLLKEGQAKTFQKNNFFDKLSSKSLSEKGFFSEKISYLYGKARLALRPIVDSAIEEPELLSNLLEHFGLFKMKETQDEYLVKLTRSLAKRNAASLKGLVEVSSPIEGELVYMPVGVTLTARQSHSGWKIRNSSNTYSVFVDGCRYFQQIFLFHEIKQRINDMADSDAYVISWLEEDLKKQVLRLMEDNHNVLIVEPWVLEEPAILEFLESLGASTRVPKQKEKAVGMSFFLPLWFIRDFRFRPEKAYCGHGNDFTVCIGTRVADSFLSKLISLLLDDYEEEKKEDEFYRKLSGDYARSFETKRNIPQKVLEAMESSSFNNYFGYVEFDEDVDLSKMELLYKQFHALAKYIGLEAHKDVSLRFRKLGNHKALGLYYPSKKCICVDLSSPGSFSHELLHMLDYENGRLSHKASFYEIKSLYKKCFEQEMDKRKIELKGKYDKSYYFQSTEIFARTGEIYFTRLCSIDNSVVKPELEGVAYPQSKELDERIKSYFDDFFKKEVFSNVKN